MNRLLLVGILSWAGAAWAEGLHVRADKDSGVISDVSTGPFTVSPGSTQVDIVVPETTRPEDAIVVDGHLVSNTQQQARREQQETQRLAKHQETLLRIRTKLGLTEEEFEDLREALRE